MTRLELLAALLIERFGPDAALRAWRDYDAPARGQLIDDLPPNNRPIVVVRAVRP
jgi:hypothetical protein